MKPNWFKECPSCHRMVLKDLDRCNYCNYVFSKDFKMKTMKNIFVLVLLMMSNWCFAINKYASATGNWSAIQWKDAATGGNNVSKPTGDDVAYANSYTVTIDEDITCQQINTLTNGGQFRVTTARTINADVLAGTSTCVYANHNTGTVVITGNVTGGSSGTNPYGCINYSTGTINITGNVTSGNAVNSYGCYNYTSGTINITGDITGGSYSNVYGCRNNSGTIKITGNVTGGNAESAFGCYNYATGTIIITGNIYDGTAYGVYNNNPAGIVTLNDMAAWYKMDDKAASNVVKDSVIRNNGTSIHNTTNDMHVIGKIGGALKFDGTWDTIRITANTNYAFKAENSNGYTISMWVKIDEALGNARCFFGFEHIDYPDSKIKLYLLDQYDMLYGVIGTGYAVGIANIHFPTWQGKWTLMTMVVNKVNATTANVAIYMNGSFRANGDNFTHPFADFNLSAIPMIGALSSTLSGDGSSSYSSPTKGSIDDVRIYNKALTAAEVLQLYQQSSGGSWLGNYRWLSNF